MASEIKLPEIGEGTAEGEIIKWLVSEGEVVDEDTPLVEVMTDKATVEIPSPFPGTILELRAKEGEVVDVGAVILLIGNGEDDASREVSEDREAHDTTQPDDHVDSTTRIEAQEIEEDPVAAARAMARAELDAEGDGPAVWEVPLAAVGAVPSTPATRRLARELGIDLHGVQGTGKGGRVTKADLLEGADRGAVLPEHSPVLPAATDEPGSITEAGDARTPFAGNGERLPSDSGAPLEERVPLRGLRRRIAERLSEAKRLIPHYTYVEECDMTEVVALRQEAKEMASAEGLRVTYLPFLIKALIEACRRHPILNSSLDEESGEIVLKHYYNVGIATDTERGLLVPVVKNADRLSIFELAREIERLSADARAGRSSADDLQGGTITITSTGSIGGLLATPIINHPEVAILGVPAIRKRPVVRGDEIVIRSMVNLSLSLDHRIVDGAPAAQFTRDLVALLEDPKLQLLAP
ncbi:MAG TPA: dihydrolipoamide acetyltransferase family protein [Acidobacteriota bacterium]|nr:dihydrolipoamide acetyltransferase family protein [Acidobacteriota bacterium]